ncbi:unnamed protein product [Brugia timori]|uniref:Secreted protein n=1 Tax=Brugia timori TaxID=42155 RepID=A0A0R3QBV0_9BILA|nr:unnamed protein product [Brugia timori]
MACLICLFDNRSFDSIIVQFWARRGSMTEMDVSARCCLRNVSLTDSVSSIDILLIEKFCVTSSRSNFSYNFSSLIFSQTVPKILSLGIFIQLSVFSCAVDFGIFFVFSFAPIASGTVRSRCMLSCSSDGGGGGGGSNGGHIGGTEDDDGLGDSQGSDGNVESVESALVLE